MPTYMKGDKLEASQIFHVFIPNLQEVKKIFNKLILMYFTFINSMKT